MEILVLGVSVLVPLLVIALYASYKSKQEEQKEKTLGNA